MSMIQKLDPKEARALQEIGGRVMLGAELMRRLEIRDPGELYKLLKPLVGRDLVQVSGDLSPDRVAFAAFSMRPSDFQYIRKQILESLE
jgi:hypothetical protein